MRNRDIKFLCKDVQLKVERNDTIFTSKYDAGELITIPIAHHDGNYFASEDTLKELEDEGRVAFRYVDDAGNATQEANPNGSQNNIAGIYNKTKKVLGLMPHPERLISKELGGTDGRGLFESLLEALH
jgi:phosphoribosylformylglycinamidine synthase